MSAVDKKTLAALAERIRKPGATTYMEVVSTSPADALNSARVAVELGIDRLLGGTDVARRPGDHRATARSPTTRSADFPSGHPTKLGGRPDQVEAHCRRFIEQGCAGTDLLAYRATVGRPDRAGEGGAARPWRGNHLIVAGSVVHARADRDSARGRRRRLHHRLGGVRRLLCARTWAPRCPSWRRSRPTATAGCRWTRRHLLPLRASRRRSAARSAR